MPETATEAPLRIVFAGSPDFAATVLKALAASRFPAIAVFTQPDKPAGRGRKLRPNAVKQLAQTLGLPVHQPASLRNDAAQAILAQYQPDVLIVAAYGLILPTEVLQLPSYGCLNVHASMLPRWRGAAPIERAIMAGDTTTGVCIMQMEEGLDTGGVYASAETAIDEPADPLALEHTLAATGARLLIEVLEEFAAHHRGSGPLPKAVPQPEVGVTYAHKLTASDRNVDWTQSAAGIARQINALSARQPVRCMVDGCGLQLLAARVQEELSGEIATLHESIEPGTITGADKKGIRIQCGSGEVSISRLKIERGKGTAMDAAAAVNGFSDLLRSGVRVTDPASVLSG